MTNAVNTTQKMRRKEENHKFSRTMAVILGLIVTVGSDGCRWYDI